MMPELAEQSFQQASLAPSHSPEMRYRRGDFKVNKNWNPVQSHSFLSPQVVMRLVRLLKDGSQIKQLLDRVIDCCSVFQNLRWETPLPLPHLLYLFSLRLSWREAIAEHMALASAAKAQSDQATFIFTQQRAVSYLEVQPPFSSFLPNTIRRDTFTSSASRLISIISRFRMGVYPLHPLRNTLTNTLKSVIWQRKSCLSEPLSFCGNIIRSVDSCFRLRVPLSPSPPSSTHKRS